MIIVVDRLEFDDVLDRLRQAKVVCVDTETTGLHPYGGDHICGVGLSFNTDEAWYLPFRHVGSFHEESPWSNLPEEWLTELCEAISKVEIIIGYNIKFDLKFLAKEGFTLQAHHKFIDVHIMARLCCPERFPPGGLSLQTMEERFIGPGHGRYNDKLKEWMRERKLWVDSRKVRLFSQVPIEIMAPYCCKDVLYTAKLKSVFQKLIVTSDQVKVWQTEVECTWDFFKAESTGVAVDLEYCKKAVGVIEQRLLDIIEEVFQLTGSHFNFNSNPQITKAMNSVGVFSPVLTKGGKDGKKKQQSWGKEVLKVMGKDAHPAMRLIREYLTLKNLKVAFLEKFVATGGVLYGSFSQAGTFTGRVSSHDPNLQNIPAMIQGTTDDEEAEEVILHHDTLAKMLGVAVVNTYTIIGKTYETEAWDEADGSMVAARRALIPRPGMVFIKADYDQMEMIAFICYVGNKELLRQIEQSYIDGNPLDFHNFITKEVWGLEPGDEGFKEARKAAKVLNFSMIYGAGLKKIAAEIGVSLEEAKAYREQYFERIKGSETFVTDVNDCIVSRGWVKNLFGRRYNIEPMYSYKGTNYLVQGSCADFLKNRMVALRQLLVDNDSYILLQVHDELVIEVPKERVYEIARRVKEILEERVFTIPLPVSIEICSDSWLTGTKMQEWEPVGNISRKEGLYKELQIGYA